MPTLEWIGKSKVINHHQDVPFRVLERKYSFDENGQHDEDNGSENMIIRGDNLEALKALLPRYEGRVKCIYIDPPYNTGNEGWVYNDNVNDPKIKKWLGEVVGKEGEDLTRHDKWLCMMYPRLKLLQKLLADDGVIFISIDEIEHRYLELVMDEIFGSANRIDTFVWQNNYGGGAKSNYVVHLHEYDKQGVFQNLLQLSTLDNGKIKTASIVKFALRYLVTVTPAEGKQSLFNYWDGDKNALLAMDGNAIEEYVKFCVSTLRNYFGAIKKNLRKQWDDTDSKLLSVISINGFIIALTRQLSVNGVNDFAFYDRIFNGWTIDFSKGGFKYTSSQYRKFSTQILREVFQISDEIIATI